MNSLDPAARCRIWRHSGRRARLRSRRVCRDWHREITQSFHFTYRRKPSRLTRQQQRILEARKLLCDQRRESSNMRHVETIEPEESLAFVQGMTYGAGDQYGRLYAITRLWEIEGAHRAKRLRWIEDDSNSEECEGAICQERGCANGSRFWEEESESSSSSSGSDWSDGDYTPSGDEASAMDDSKPPQNPVAPRRSKRWATQQPHPAPAHKPLSPAEARILAQNQVE